MFACWEKLAPLPERYNFEQAFMINDNQFIIPKGPYINTYDINSNVWKTRKYLSFNRGNAHSFDQNIQCIYTYFDSKLLKLNIKTEKVKSYFKLRISSGLTAIKVGSIHHFIAGFINCQHRI